MSEKKVEGLSDDDVKQIVEHYLSTPRQIVVQLPWLEPDPVELLRGEKGMPKKQTPFGSTVVASVTEVRRPESRPETNVRAMAIQAIDSILESSTVKGILWGREDLYDVVVTIDLGWSTKAPGDDE